MKRRFLVVFLVVWLIFPYHLGAIGIPVFDMAKWLQDMHEYFLEAFRFTEQMVQIYKEVEYMFKQLKKLEEMKKFTDDFMELYRFTLEHLEIEDLNRIIGEQTPISYESPPVSGIMEELAGKDAGDYQKYLEASRELRNVEEMKDMFSKIYWDLNAIREYIEEAFPDRKDETRKFLELQSKALGIMEAKKIAADATISRMRSIIRTYVNETIPDNERIIKEAADNPTKILQTQAAGIVNLQKMGTQQLILISRGVELLSELLADKAKEKAEIIKNIMEEQRFNGKFERNKDEYIGKVKGIIEETSEALFEILTTSRWEKEGKYE